MECPYLGEEDKGAAWLGLFHEERYFQGSIHEHEMKTQRRVNTWMTTEHRDSSLKKRPSIYLESLQSGWSLFLPYGAE